MDSGKLLAIAAFAVVIVVGLALRPKPAPPPAADEGPEVVAAPATPAANASTPPVATRPVAPTAVAPAIAVQLPPSGSSSGAGFVAQPIDPAAVEVRTSPLTGAEALGSMRERQQAAAAEFRASHAKPGELIANAKPGITSEEVRKRDASFEEVRKKERTFDMLSGPEQEAVRGKIRSLETDILSNPQDASLYGKLAGVQREAKLEMMALDTLERGLARAPNDITLMSARAKVLADYGFGQKAAAAYEQILKVKPDDADAKAALEVVRRVYLPGK